MKIRFLLLVVSLFTLASGAEAKLKLPAVIGDHMVLQQKMPLALWGWDDPGQTVSVSLAGKSASMTTGSDGKWKVSFPALKAGGPYDMVISGSESVTVQDVLVGEVWIGSGQSNMELAMRVTNDADKEIPAAQYPKIRFFTVERNSSFTPNEDLVGSWKVCTPDTVKDFSAVAYHFGQGLHQALKVPVGLIASDWGGTPGEDWVPRPALDRENAFASLLSQWDNDEVQQSTWKKGLDFEFQFSDVRLIPKDPKQKPVPILLESGQKGLGGNWGHSEKPGSKTNYGISGKAHSGSGPAALFSGLMEGGAWGSASTPLTASGTVDLTPYDSIEFYAKGKGKFLMTIGQPSITDYDYYASDAFEVFKDWKYYSFPLGKLKQGGWGSPKPLTLDQMQNLSFAIQPPYWPDVPSIVYNGMIAPLTPYKIRGVIWYQGESNTGRAGQYHLLLSTLIRSWREAWGEKFPFLIVQLPNYMERKADPTDSDWAKLREAQFQTLDVPNTGLITTIDLGEAGNIHPKDKTDVGKRAALAGLMTAYHKPIVGSGPLFFSAIEKNGKMIVKFKEAGKGLVTKEGGPVTGFALAGSDGQFHWAEAKIVRGGVVIVSSEQVSTPVAVRYAWADNPACNLYNKEGLPASPFQFNTQPFKEAPKPVVTKGKDMPAVDGKLLVDDFESGKPQNLLGGPWQVQFDNGGLGTVIKNKDAFIVKGGANGSKGCARITGHMGKLAAPWPYASLYTSLAGEEPMDLSGYKSIEFMAKGDGKTYEVQLYISQITDYSHYRLSFATPKEWTKIHLDMASFHQPDWGNKAPQDYSSVREIIFAPSGMNDEDFDLSIDDVTLVK